MPVGLTHFAIGVVSAMSEKSPVEIIDEANRLVQEALDRFQPYEWRSIQVDLSGETDWVYCGPIIRASCDDCGATTTMATDGSANQALYLAATLRRYHCAEACRQ